MRTLAEYELVRSLLAEGLTHAEVARRSGVPRRTLRKWLYNTPAYLRGCGRMGASGCPECEHVVRARSSEVAPSYAYLLGLYLGDGSISSTPKGVYRLRIAQDQRYVRLIEACIDVMATVLPQSKVAVQQRIGCVEVNSHSKHWPCLFPQHGPGRKHERHIELVEWQQRVVDAHPEQLLSGLIHSDGCRATNRVHRPVAGQRKTCEYPRYFFSNMSPDIRGIFTDACDRLGIAWRQNRHNSISVARREAVAALDRFVVAKA